MRGLLIRITSCAADLSASHTRFLRYTRGIAKIKKSINKSMPFSHGTLGWSHVAGF